ncbi:MAG: hypothetical protein NTZ94_08960 [Verrucomicrobia bacterium]|nr:hypothetical protein [Verrucomicrobiota bacterium]
MEKPTLPLKPLQAITEAVWILLILAIGLTAFTWNHESVFFGGEVYFTDGDCYARMTRVRMIEAEGLHSIRSHAFENFPEGTTPHTTMPLDALIAGLSQILRPFFSNHLSLAGAWISPLLGLALLVFLAAWSFRLRLPYRRAMLLLVAVSPILAHGFQIGRPDHQSLLVFLIAVAIAAEVSIVLQRGRAWVFVSASAWALALWVSLFEPLILLVLVLANRGAFLVFIPRLRPNLRQIMVPVGLFVALLAAALIIDGWRAAAFHPAFDRWAQNIGELRSTTPSVLFGWCGWLLVILPLLLAWRFRRDREIVGLVFLGPILATAGLTLHHARWGYFVALFCAMALPWALSALRRRWLAWLAFVVSLWPIASDWDHLLYPTDSVWRARAENLADAVALREAATRLRGLPQGGVMAPWWFCPAIVWWSGQPCIGGSSHQSLPGIVDSCEFYLSESPEKAEGILKKRQIRYIFAYEPERVISNSAQILGRQSISIPLGASLYKHPKENWLDAELIYANRYFNVLGVRSR